MTFLLNTQRLVLRPLYPTDARSIFAYRSQPEVNRYQLWAIEYEDVRSLIASQQGLDPDIPGTWFQAGITLHESGELIGDLGLHFLEGDNRQVEFGVTLSPAWQGQGIATESISAVLEYLFSSLGKHRVYASADPRNLRSVALMERLGLRKEGCSLKSVWNRGEWTDDVTYAMLEDEWKTLSLKPDQTPS